jgi:hypothetical protein
MIRKAQVLVLAVVSLTMVGCSSPNAPARPPSVTTTAVESPLSLVVIGDSIPYNAEQDCPGCKGFVIQYTNALAEATGRKVATDNRSKHTGLTLPGLMKDLPDLQGVLSAADAIIIGIAHNSFPLNEESPCGSSIDEATGVVKDWSGVDAGCAKQATTKYRPVYDELFSTVAGWRSGKPTILLTVNRYNDLIGFERAKLTPEQAARTVVLLDAWNTMLCASAEAHGFDCADIYHAFNGKDGSTAAAALLAQDYTHPSQLGNDEIFRLLKGRGFAPLG